MTHYHNSQPYYSTGNSARIYASRSLNLDKLLRGRASTDTYDWLKTFTVAERRPTTVTISGQNRILCNLPAAVDTSFLLVWRRGKLTTHSRCTLLNLFYDLRSPRRNLWLTLAFVLIEIPPLLWSVKIFRRYDTHTDFPPKVQLFSSSAHKC